MNRTLLSITLGALLLSAQTGSADSIDLQKTSESSELDGELLIGL
jgi:hypothetical protein